MSGGRVGAHEFLRGGHEGGVEIKVSELQDNTTKGGWDGKWK